jgi:N-acetylglucosamine-6-phosphate deacetylase
MYVEIIADGKHLPIQLLKLIYKVKGADKVCLITDGMRAAGFSDGQTSMLGRIEQGALVFVEDGVAKLPDRQSFAGSVATTDRLFRTMASAIGDNWVDLMKMSALTPAKVMGLEDRGEIAVGKRADLLIMDKDYNINKVIFKGDEI